MALWTNLIEKKKINYWLSVENTEKPTEATTLFSRESSFGLMTAFLKLQLIFVLATVIFLTFLLFPPSGLYFLSSLSK